jgi:glycerophosphoryl diester phosphodiesterase
VERSRVVIAHRGASGYLPEHTSEAKALAHAMGADFLEQDVVLSRDDVPVVLHDVVLDTVTNVASVFPDRARADGRWYALDFTWAELQRLRVHERIDHRTGRAAYPGRFPSDAQCDFRLSSLADELQLIAGLNRSTRRAVGVYPEIKHPAWHRAQGRDVSRRMLDVLQEYGWTGEHAPVYLQCFDPAELIRIREELGCPLPLVQLIGDDSWADARGSFDALCTPQGLATLARTVQAIGPWIPRVIRCSKHGAWESTGLCEAAQAAGLQVHAFTVRADDLPAGCDSLDTLHHALFETAGVEGAFSDFPDQTLRWLLGRRVAS